MKSVSFFLICILFTLLTSCGLFRKTAREKSTVAIESKMQQSFIDTSVITERSSIDTTITVPGSEDFFTIPVDYSEDSSLYREFETPRFIARINFNPRLSRIKAHISLKPVQVPVRMHRITETRKNITAVSDAELQIRKKDTAVQHTPTIRWSWIIALALLLVFAFFYFKTKSFSK